MQVSVGYSNVPVSETAGLEATRQAILGAARTEACDMMLLFCTARHDQEALRAAVVQVTGPGIPIYGGGAVGIITNENFGYAGDQVGVACFWLDETRIEVIVEPDLEKSEEETGERLGTQLACLGIESASPVMLFYDSIYRTPDSMRMLMATYLLSGIEKSLGRLSNLSGAGLMGDHGCTPTRMFTGDGIAAHCAMALSFSDDIQIDSTIMHGCRPASGYYTVTKADGPVILEINNVPAIPFLDSLLDAAIKPEQFPFFLLFGINHGDEWGEYDENLYASRLCLGIDAERNGIVMFEPDMAEGTQFQLMYRSLNYGYMKPKIDALFDALGDREPVFAMYIDCAGRCAGYGGNDIEDAVFLQEGINGRVPLLGIYSGVEIAPLGGKPRGLDWTGVLCLFSRGKNGEKRNQSNTAINVWGQEPSVSGETTIEAALRLAERNAAKILELDTKSIIIRHELEQKRRGFHLLAELSASLRRESDYRSVFASVARKINASLNMQKTAALIPTGNSDGSYTPLVLQGFSISEKTRLYHKPLIVEPELLHPEAYTIITSADDPRRFSQLRSDLGLPYFVSIPVMVQSQIVAILITGRMSEQPPFLSPLGSGDGETVQAIGALMTSVLISHRLADAEDRARVMLDTTPLCANFCDEHHNVIDCNLEAVKLFDLSDKQDYLNRFYELSPVYQPNGALSRDLITMYLSKAFREGRFVFEWMHQKLNKEEIPTEITLVRVQYKNANVVVGYTRDLRELKARMAEIEHTQAALSEARDRAEESSRAKSNFLSNMSHEIRTPLNAIVGMAHIARQNVGSNEKAMHSLDEILNASKHLMGLINNVLDLSKIDSGKLELVNESFDLPAAMQEVASLINPRCVENCISFKTNLENLPKVTILGDKLRLKQVLINLLGNSVKFTEQDGVIQFLVDVVEQGQQDISLRFTVSDNGIGITKEQQKTLFTAFEQGDRSIAFHYGGTGLGLAISQSLVQAMGGEILVVSEQNEGATFDFTIKFLKVDIPKALTDRTVEISNLSFPGRHILLAEDIDINRVILTELLGETGIIIEEAVDGKQALQMFEKSEIDYYDLIFMDIQMPNMDGYQATKAIRELARPDAKRVPIIAMTANAYREDVDRALESGMNGHLAKPIDIDAVRELLYVELRAE